MMTETGIIPKKSKGQNFLIDDRVAERHVNFAEISPEDHVLEVGPGLGILTEKLVDVSGHLTCIELDDILAGHVEDRFGDRLTLIKGDAVKVDFPKFDKFVSNLPYSVSTPIIFKLLEHEFDAAVVMVQKEFADRMVADVGSPDYSRLTVNLFYRADCKFLEKVPRSRFKPQPKVDSALVKIVPRPAPFHVDDEELFFKVTEVTFNHRRKQIGTSLRSASLIENDWDIPHLEDRVEHLRPVEIADIVNAIHRCRNGKSITP